MSSSHLSTVPEILLEGVVSLSLVSQLGQGRLGPRLEKVRQRRSEREGEGKIELKINVCMLSLIRGGSRNINIVLRSVSTPVLKSCICSIFNRRRKMLLAKKRILNTNFLRIALLL
jgi:hypothetical protein